MKRLNKGRRDRRSIKYLDYSEAEDTPGLAMIRQINQLVPADIPCDVREDICQDMLLSALSGESIETIAENPIKFWLREHRRKNHERFGTISIDLETQEGLYVKDLIDEGPRIWLNSQGIVINTLDFVVRPSPSKVHFSTIRTKLEKPGNAVREVPKSSGSRALVSKDLCACSVALPIYLADPKQD